ncbi:hypothetical protein BDB01DRAFT_327726 [Pilobolus umbonatus]|nr:hypothetical protein BDB01DRAFT_327726 [Pilobolus umbonatus]
MDDNHELTNLYDPFYQKDFFHAEFDDQGYLPNDNAIFGSIQLNVISGSDNNVDNKDSSNDAWKSPVNTTLTSDYTNHNPLSFLTNDIYNSSILNDLPFNNNLYHSKLIHGIPEQPDIIHPMSRPINTVDDSHYQMNEIHFQNNDSTHYQNNNNTHYQNNNNTHYQNNNNTTTINFQNDPDISEHIQSTPPTTRRKTEGSLPKYSGGRGKNKGRGGRRSSTNTHNEIKFNGKAKSVSNDGNSEKRKYFLERNRQAALECRQRKKQWLSNLQQRVEYLTTDNDQLQVQADMLREEIINLKTLLLTHRDCPVAQKNSQALFNNPVASMNMVCNFTNDSNTESPYSMISALGEDYNPIDN